MHKMFSTKELEEEVEKLGYKNFAVFTEGLYKHKEVRMVIEDFTFKSTADNWEDAYSSVFNQFLGWYNTPSKKVVK